MNHGPIPTRLAFISDLTTLPQGTKVRFLGCVTDYSQTSGTLVLQHAYPPAPSQCARVLIDVNLLLENLKSTDTRIGEWVNVMGYIERQGGTSQAPRELDGRVRSRKRKPGVDAVNQWNGGEVKVQAIMLWSAGAIKLSEYEKSLEGRKRREEESVPKANC